MSPEEIVKRLLEIHNSMPASKARWKLSDLIDEIEGVNV